jgi:hypothetical protein
LASGGVKVNCRGMMVAKGDEKKGEGTVLVAASDPKQNGSLKSNEAVVIELRLKHIKL